MNEFPQRVVSLRCVARDPRQVGTGTCVHGWTAGQTVARGLEDERGNTGNLVAGADWAVHWTTAVTL